MNNLPARPLRRATLAQLLRLDHERYEAEVKAGLQEQQGQGKQTAAKQPSPQTLLLGD